MRALSNLTVGTRLALGYAILLTLMMVILFTGLSRMSLLQQNLDTVVRKDAVFVDTANVMRDAVRYQSVAIRDVVMEEDIAFKKRELKLMKEARATYLSAAESLGKGMHLPEEIALLAKLKPLEEEVQAQVKEVIGLSLSDLTADASKLTREKLRPKQIELIAQLDAILGYLKKQTLDAEESSVASYEQGKIFMWVLGAISIVLGVLISSSITRSIARPIREAVRVAKNIAEGDLTSRIDIKGSDELASLLKVLSNMNDRLAQVIGLVKQSAHVVTRSSVDLSAATERVATLANNQAKQVREIGTASELVTLSIAEVATAAARVATAAAKTRETARTGDSNMEQGVQATQRMVASVTESSTTIEHLSEAINKITDVTRVIKEIADQTNLLALNAAIEAARAGEQGRGFAVVADEVRNLAQRTATSTTDIAKMINSISGQTAAAVNSMKKVTSDVQESERFADATRQLLRSIVTDADAVNGLAQGIVSSTRDQEAASSETAAGMEKISAITDENANSLKQVDSAASALAETATELQNLVDQFQVSA